MLKNVPKSLLVKICQTQAAKAGQHDPQFVAGKGSVKVPKTFWAGHIRNVYITKNIVVLLMNVVRKKIQISYRGGLTVKETEAPANYCQGSSEVGDILWNVYSDGSGVKQWISWDCLQIKWVEN